MQTSPAGGGGFSLSPATAAFPTNKRGETTRNGSNYQRRGGKHSIMALSCLLHPAGPNGAAFSARRTEKRLEEWLHHCISRTSPRLACRKFETRHSKIAPPASVPLLVCLDDVPWEVAQTRRGVFRIKMFAQGDPVAGGGLFAFFQSRISLSR